jgi:hypothetical protein
MTYEIEVITCPGQEIIKPVAVCCFDVIGRKSSVISLGNGISQGQNPVGLCQGVTAC